MDPKELCKRRLARINRTIALEKPDRTPVVLEYAAFAARVTDTPLDKFYSSTAKSMETMIKAYHAVGEVAEADAIHYGSMPVYSLSYLWMSKVRVSGVDLPEHVPHQVVETELLKVEDYDRILDQDWPDFFQRFLAERVFDDVPPEMLFFNQQPLDIRAEWEALGVPVLNGGVISPPLELLCGGRSLAMFINDLFTIPDKVQAVMDTIVPHLTGPTCQLIKEQGYGACWVGGWRGASNMLSPKLWERFVWPYLERLVREVVDSGLVAILHLDANWTRDLKYFRSLPKGKCIMATDGDTDLFKAKDILGDHMCLMGDVPATMLSLGTPDEVYDYSLKLIRELGPQGFILQSGCDVPTNAKLANVQAMVAAATGQ